jgi:signal transduction histidine kinase
MLVVFLAGQVVLTTLAMLDAHLGAPRALAIGAIKALIVGLQLVHSLPRLRPMRARYWKWTLTAQGLLSFLPFFAFGGLAIAGGSLAGSALLLFRRTVAWTWFALIVATDLGLLAATHASARAIAGNVADGTVVIALATYALTRLTDVITELRATRTAMAQATAREARLRAARDVFGTLGTQLAGLAHAAEQARHLAAAQPESARQIMTDLAAGARHALAQARATSRSFRTADSGGRMSPDGFPVAHAEPRLAFAIVVVMSITGAAASLAAITGTGTDSAAAAAAAAGLSALAGLEIYHGAPRRSGGLPRGGQWTLTAQLLLVYLPIAVFGTNWYGMASYFGACALVALRPPRSWMLFGAVTASLPIIAAALSQSFLAGADFVLDSLWTVLIFYGPVRLAKLTLELRAARAELARVMLVQAWLEVARDLHDVLGASLTAAALKADLACRLMPRDPRRADAELADVAALAQRAVAEAQALSGAQTGTTLAEEIASTRSVLAAAGVETTVATSAVPGGIPAQVDRVLAVVVREGVTNVLRHSAAISCAITMRVDAGVLRLEVTNDGVPPVQVPDGCRLGGSGISNLSARIEAITGTLTAGPDGRGFTLTAEVPLAPQPAQAGPS